MNRIKFQVPKIDWIQTKHSTNMKTFDFNFS